MNKHLIYPAFAAIAVLASAVSAGDYSGGGNGTAEQPYRISTAADMNNIGAHPNDWDKHFVLTDDIDLAEYTGTEFSIIGNYSGPFTGVFDGNGHTISNFTYTTTDAGDIGLFGYVDDANAVIEDLTLVTPDVNVAGNPWRVGCLVGWLRNGTITSCSIESGSVTGDFCTGGLVGLNDGTISNCYAADSVTGTKYVGGLVGINDGTISNCYAVGSVIGGDCTGGLVGKGGGAVNCFWDVETSEQSQSAGGTGKTTVQMKTASTFFGWGGCGNEEVWTIDDGNDYPRLAWESRPGQPLPVQQLGDFVTGSGTSADPYLIYTAEELNLVGLFTCEWDKYFLLMADIDLSAFSGTEFNIIGTKDTPFTGAFDGSDHTISNFTYTATDTDYIGFFGYAVSSHGLYPVIKDLTLVTPDVNASGESRCVGCLVGRLEYGTISGCGIEGGSVSGDFVTGGLVGNNDGTIENCYAAASVMGDDWTGGLVGRNGGTISDSYSAGSVAGDENVGGLVGCNEFGPISNCYAAGSVSGRYYSTGGLVGENYGPISNCYAAASVMGDDWTGGLVGYNRGPISNCYATGNVSGDVATGGLVGDNGGTIENCSSVGSVTGDYRTGGLVGRNYKCTVSNCYAAGIVDGNDFVGGLIGYDLEDYGDYTKSFWDKDVNPDVNGIGNASDPNVIGESTVNMQKESTFTDAGWDFITPIWKICEGEDYPRLWWEECPEPVEAELLIFPPVINRYSGQKNILAWLRLPEGVAKEQISDEPILLYPGEIEAVNQYVIEHGPAAHKRTSVLAFFNKAELMGAVVDNGEVEVEAVGSLKSGRYFYGSDTVLIKTRRYRPSRRWW